MGRQAILGLKGKPFAKPLEMHHAKKEIFPATQRAVASRSTRDIALSFE